MEHVVDGQWMAVLFLLGLAAGGRNEPDSDRDGLSDFAETHKYFTDPFAADSDGDGVPDGDWRERREYQYTVRTVVQVMRPVTVEFLDDDHQDVRVLDETAEYVELEVIHYPFTTVAAAIAADPDWRRTAAAMPEWTAPGPTADWTPALRNELVAELGAAGIDAAALDDLELVRRASRWLCERGKPHDFLTTFATAFDASGKRFLPDDLAAALRLDPPALERHWERDVSARGMFEQRVRGSCSPTAIYLNGCLRALGIPTRIVLCIPVVDANDPGERRLLERGLTHHALREQVTAAIAKLEGSWASHSFNEVFVGGRWRRLDHAKLGRGIADPDLFGLITHVATFSDWADARMADTIGRRQTLRRYDDLFGGPNPYSTISLRDEFGPHCRLENPPPEPLAGRVTAAHWGDGPDVPPDVSAWFAERGVFGLVVRIEGPKGVDEMKRLLAESDVRVHLVAQGKPTLAVELAAGNFWWKNDHALVVVPFGRADREGLDPSTSYRFVPRNERGSAWKVADTALVPPRASAR